MEEQTVAVEIRNNAALSVKVSQIIIYDKQGTVLQNYKIIDVAVGSDMCMCSMRALSFYAIGSP